MRWTVLRSVSLVALLSAYSCGGASSPRPSDPEPEPEDEAPEPEARLSVERHSGYGADWDAAYDAILSTRLQAFARLGARRVVLKPHAVDGSTFPHIVRVHLYFDHGDSKSIAVVADGQLLERSAGPDGLVDYLAALGFPRQLLPAPLMSQLVCYFEGAIAERDPWCAAVAEEPRADARVQRTRDGAALILERALAPSPGEPDVEDAGELGEVPHRLVLRFDGEAGLTVLPFRQSPDGSWQPIPLD